MVGLGTIINTAAIVAGGVLGKLFGRFLSESAQESLTRVCGVSTLFIAIAGALEGMMKVQGDSLVSGQSLLIICCLALGALIGEMLGIKDGLKRFGEWLKRKTGNERDAGFVNAFVTTSLTVCVGAMAIVGAIEDGINGDYSILATKAVLDLIIVIVMTGSMGKGCAFSAIPVAHSPGLRHGSGGTAEAGYDGPGACEPVPHRLGADLLRGGQFGLGPGAEGGQYAARAGAGGGRGVFARNIGRYARGCQS